MKTLAIEQSTPLCSVALMEETAVMAEKRWEEIRPRGHMLFGILPQFLDSISVKLGDVDIFASGIGPGSFSGLRIACTAVNIFALPGQAEVSGIPSVNALAFDIFRETGAKSVTVVGDSRRDQLWVARFESIESATSKEKPSILTVPCAELETALIPGSVVVSPDFERFSDALVRAADSVSARLVAEARVPRASTIGVLAFMFRDKGSLSAHPIYLHPAVRKIKQ